MEITVAPALREIWPQAALGVLCYTAEVQPSCGPLLADFEAELAWLAGRYQLDTITKNPHVDATRRAYKALGKSPSEYRNSAEAMLRRIVKGSGLYHINNVIELNNLISVRSGYAVGSYDVEQLRGRVELCRAEDGAHYDGIGKSSVNIQHLPVLRDELGYFGSPTSDSQRAMIKEGRRRVCSVIYAFDGPDAVAEWVREYAASLEKYLAAAELTTQVI
ncbi:MAG: hypothetical protein IK116_08090 [Firmicutes bacterium]|nr:hypothetical protein [Bacillota bacterium]